MTFEEKKFVSMGFLEVCLQYNNSILCEKKKKDDI